MSEIVQTDPNAPPSEAPNPDAPPSTPPATSTEPAFAWGDDAPDFLRGKTQQETLAWVNNLVSEVKQLYTQKPGQPASSPPQRTMEQNLAELPDPDMALTDSKGYQDKLTSYFNSMQDQRLAQYAAPVFGQLATQSRELSKKDPENTDVWTKYGAEIDAVVNAVPPQARTKELYDQAAVMVRGKHVKEIATEMAEKMAANTSGIARASSDGDASIEDAGSNDVWEKIAATPLGKHTMDTLGKKGILTAIRKGVYKDLDDYAAQVGRSKSKVSSSKAEVYSRG